MACILSEELLILFSWVGWLRYGFSVRLMSRRVDLGIYLRSYAKFLLAENATTMSSDTLGILLDGMVYTSS